MKAQIIAQEEGFRNQFVTLDKNGDLIACSIYTNTLEEAAELTKKHIKELERMVATQERYSLKIIY